MPGMKHRALYTCLTILIGFAVQATIAMAETPNLKPQFFTVLPDVPIMPQFSELRDSAVIFDKPDGRVAEPSWLARLPNKM